MSQSESVHGPRFSDTIVRMAAIVSMAAMAWWSCLGCDDQRNMIQPAASLTDSDGDPGEIWELTSLRSVAVKLL